MSSIWEHRLRRAEELQQAWPFAREILQFLRAVTSFQQDIYRRVRSTPVLKRNRLDTALLASYFPPLLALVERYGPRDLWTQAQRLRDRTESDWERIIRAYWNRSGSEGDLTVPFFPKAILQPYTIYRAELWRAELGAWGEQTNVCPFCARAPGVSLLRGEPQGRILACSLCATEWDFPSTVCPSCKEARLEKRPQYGSRDIPWIRIEGCDSCRIYLKSIDVRRNPAAEAAVDEIGSTPLDVIARDRKYTKLESNLVGV
ncbi:MAG: formate dehydrogenase accessory protein FdhE [Planctomycetes bacterium]|nr:formate dehydrogenase accessory protein FdhE [Planctomycetota bacterium]